MVKQKKSIALRAAVSRKLSSMFLNSEYWNCSQTLITPTAQNGRFEEQKRQKKANGNVASETGKKATSGVSCVRLWLL